MEPSPAFSSPPAVVVAEAALDPANAHQPAAHDDNSDQKAPPNDSNNNNNSNNNNSSNAPAAGAQGWVDDIASLFPPAADTLNKFLDNEHTFGRYVAAAQQHQQNKTELSTARENLDAFIQRCHPPGTASLVLPRAFNLDLIKNARFQEVPGQADIYKEHREELHKIQTDTTKKVYEVIIKAKQAHIAALEKRAGALTFVTSQVPAFSKYVEHFAASYNKYYGIASTDAYAFPVNLVVKHFRDFLAELIHLSVMHSVSEGLEQEEAARKQAEQSRAAQELVVSGATNGKTITMLAEAAAKRQVAPLSAMMQKVTQHLADLQASKQDTQRSHKPVSQVKQPSPVVPQPKQDAVANASQPAPSLPSSSAQAQAPANKKASKHHGGSKRSWTEDQPKDEQAARKKNKKHKQASPASRSDSDAAAPASLKDRPAKFTGKRRKDEEEKGEHQKPAASSKKPRRDDRPASPSSAAELSSPVSPKNSEGGARAAAGSSKAKPAMSKVQSSSSSSKNQAHAGNDEGKDASARSSKQ
jgi:hypothetical protein